MRSHSVLTVVVPLCVAAWFVTAPVNAVRAEDAPLEAALHEMAAAERAFARLAAEKGIRAAFLAFLAPDSIGFQPTLGNAREQYAARPEPADPLAAKLEWEPRAGDIARSGASGWLTGPYTFRPPTGPPSHGCYFSVWMKYPEGWRVFLDVGITTPQPVAFPAGFERMAAPEGRYEARSGPDGAPDAVGNESEASLKALGAADLAASGPHPSGNSGLALAAAMDPVARLHRSGFAPILGRAAIVEHFKAHPWTGVVHVSSRSVRHGPRSFDFGYTWGRYGPAPAAPDPAAASGSYVRVWRRTANGRWLIVADITQPDPKK